MKKRFTEFFLRIGWHLKVGGREDTLKSAQSAVLCKRQVDCGIECRNTLPTVAGFCVPMPPHCRDGQLKKQRACRRREEGNLLRALNPQKLHQ